MTKLRGALASAILLGAAGFLGACTPAMQAYKAAAMDRGAAFYDQLLVDNENVMCRVSSAGSVARRYWTNPELLYAWMAICYPQPIRPIELPVLEQPDE